MPRVLITGSREFKSEYAMRELFKRYHERFVGCETILVHGDARGADRLSARIASSIVPDLTVETHPADWERYGKRAGFLRNQEMVDLGADLAIAFRWIGAGNRGTQDCIQRIVDAGIKLIIVDADEIATHVRWANGEDDVL